MPQKGFPLIPPAVKRGAQAVLLTFDLHEHEVLVGRGAVVGHLLGDVDAAQADPAEVFLGGQAGQCRLRVLGRLADCRSSKRSTLVRTGGGGG